MMQSCQLAWLVCCVLAPFASVALHVREEPVAEFSAPHFRQKVWSMYNSTVTERFKSNDWNLGCAALGPMLPYFRAISNRLQFINGDGPRKKLVFLDVGANVGDDADNIIHSNFAYQEMCKGYSSSYVAISVEASPLVFCQTLKFPDFSGARPSTNGRWVGLNMALSGEIGTMSFQSQGMKSGGGKLIGGITPDPKRSLTLHEFNQMQTCAVQADPNDTEKTSVSQVNVFTMDHLHSRLGEFGVIDADSEVFVMKIDVEEFEHEVLKGSARLLEKHAIKFIIYELGGKPRSAVPDFMEKFGYKCFIQFPDMLIPMSSNFWWYEHLDHPHGEWANALCSVPESKEFRMLWYMYHANDNMLMRALDVF